MSTPVVISGHAFMHLKNRRFACIELATDVTERRREQDALHEAEQRARNLRLEHAELERMAIAGEMASIVAHDVRTPLNALAINLQMAERGFEQVRTTIDRIVTSDMPTLRAQLDAAGVPWTPGRGVSSGE